VQKRKIQNRQFFASFELRHFFEFSSSLLLEYGGCLGKNSSDFYHIYHYWSHVVFIVCFQIMWIKNIKKYIQHLEYFLYLWLITRKFFYIYYFRAGLLTPLQWSFCWRSIAQLQYNFLQINNALKWKHEVLIKNSIYKDWKHAGSKRKTSFSKVKRLNHQVLMGSGLYRMNILIM